MQNLDTTKATNRVRGFEVAKGFEDKGIQLPERSTGKSAGYDFECAENITIRPIWKEFLNNISNVRSLKKQFNSSEKVSLSKLIRPTLVPTGIKAYMSEDEFLGLYNRSSNPTKLLLLLTNGVGVVDSDYHNNPDNDGHIMFQFINFGFFNVDIKKGQRIGQGIFQPFLQADKGTAREKADERQGGFGSTDA